MIKLTKKHNISLWLLLTFTSCQPLLAANPIINDDITGPMSNQLNDHPSPYLALHGSDPVLWQDWNSDVLQRARRENKIIFISSGYFSCHWCHVMQAESYKSQTVADIINRSFIPVKVDRELEPALDKRLMAYAHATLRRGGWPLNVFLSPDGLPVFASLYQPQEQFMGLLARLENVWEEQRDRIREIALAEKPLLTFADAEPRLDAKLASDLQSIAVKRIIGFGDNIEGGFGQSNKFPSAPQLNYLLDSLADNPDDNVVEFLNLSLMAMAKNGMQDHLAGGFFRYVVDPGWEIPHFEKMLYDNANLARLYLKAGTVLKQPDFTQIARDTLDFMMREMADKSGALFASFSAVDNHEVEGGYYLWQSKEIKQRLDPQEYRVFSNIWHTERVNDLEAGNHLRTAKSISAVAKALDLTEPQLESLLQSAHGKLRQARKLRTLPTDDKFIAGWNALALSAFTQAAQILGDERYRDQARKIMSFIIDTFWQKNQLSRSLAKGKLVGSAAIDDYAYVAESLVLWANLTDDDQDYQLAEAVLAQGWQRFYQNNAWSYADSSLLPPNDGEEIMTEDSSASPSSILIQSTIMLYNAGKLKHHDLYLSALSALNRGEELLRSNPFWYTTQIGAMQLVRNVQ